MRILLNLYHLTKSRWMVRRLKAVPLFRAIIWTVSGSETVFQPVRFYNWNKDQDPRKKHTTTKWHWKIMLIPLWSIVKREVRKWNWGGLIYHERKQKVKACESHRGHPDWTWSWRSWCVIVPMVKYLSLKYTISKYRKEGKWIEQKKIYTFTLYRHTYTNICRTIKKSHVPI